MRTCGQLLLEFEGRPQPADAEKINFVLKEEGKDIYNITAPFVTDGSRWIAGRVEARDSEWSEVKFFRETEGVWTEEEVGEPISLQDPFVARIHGELVLGGVEVFEDTAQPGNLNYRTVFYKGENLYNLRRAAQGPDGMKDIRLCQMEDDRILVFTRPQGLRGGRGKIGTVWIDRFAELTKEVIEAAVILEDQFMAKEWGGVNEVHLLGNGKAGVLGHIACYDEKGDRHYYCSCFCFEPQTGNYSPMKLIAVRKNFLPGPSKRPDLADVIFGGGMIRRGDGTAELYCGVSDAQGQKILIEDPFAEYELASWGGLDGGNQKDPATSESVIK